MRRTPLVAAAVTALVSLTCTSAPAGTPAPDGTASAATTRVAPDGRAAAPQRRVLAISVDGLNPAALTRLGRGRTPVLHRLLAEGASTRNARTERELTLTLPNHTGMVTGRRVDAAKRGHGVTWNTHRPGTTVQRAAGHAVASVFTVVRADGRESAVFTGKDKLTLFERSWPRGIDAFIHDTDPLDLVRAARRDLLRQDRALTFVHLATPDVAGHRSGFMSQPYLQAVAHTDRLIGKLVRAVEGDEQLRRRVVVVLTADHGGKGEGHYDEERYADYRVPFLVWGRGIEPAGLYALNPDRKAPGRSRTSYAGEQPVRNGDLANVVTALLGLGPVPGSEFGRSDPLDVDAD